MTAGRHRRRTITVDAFSKTDTQADDDLRRVPPRQAGAVGRLQALLESRRFQQAITALIVVNAVTLGLETSATVMAAGGQEWIPHQIKPCGPPGMGSFNRSNDRLVVRFLFIGGID